MSDYDESGRRVPDYDELREAHEARKRHNRIWGPCRCGGDMPGTCPGVSQCPMQQEGEDE